MKNSTNKILVLGCNYDQIPYLIELRNYYYVIGADLNSEAPGKEMCDKFYNVGYDQFDDLIKIGEEEKFTSNDKVFTAAAQFALLGCSKFAKHFNIQFISENSIEIILDKSKFYKLFDDLNVSIPKTSYIKNLDELKSKIIEIGESKTYYLKSDFSKNPNYVYKLNINTLNDSNIFWGKDRFLRNHYILQEEFIGEHLRINIIKNEDFILFPMKYGDILKTSKNDIIKLGVFNDLNKIINKLDINDWIVKFDIVANKDSYVVLDIGLDPPFRLNKFYIEKSINFPKKYIDLVLKNKSTFELLDYEN